MYRKVFKTNEQNGETKEYSKDIPTRPYLDMERQELIKHYSPRLWNNRGLNTDDTIAQHIDVLTKASDKARAEAPFQVGLSYGPTENNKLDLLLPDSLPKDCPIFVYIHGGYWYLLNREISSFMALPFYRAGAGFAAMGYDKAPHVSVKQVVSQVKSAVQYVLQIAKERGSRGVYLCGHSAGGHMAAMMLAVDWEAEANIPNSLLKGTLMLGGLYDVRCMVRTEENVKILKMTEEDAWELSPFNHLEEIAAHSEGRVVKAVIGTSDPPEFQRQAREFNQALVERGVNSILRTVEGLDHFTPAELMVDDDFVLVKEMIETMGLSQSNAK